MALSLDAATKNFQVDNLVDDLDGGTLTIYDGTAPADADTALSGNTALAAITLPTPAFGAASSGSASKSGTWEDASADATGTASFFRIVNSGASRTVQGTVTATGGGGDLELGSTSITSGGTVTITACTVAQG